MTGKTRILVVDDQMAAALMMVFLLTQAGCETEVATTGAKAMQKARTKDFDLITLEVDLPGMNGFEMCRCLKEDPRLFDTPVVFVSWRDSLEAQQHGLELGSADYIVKPFDVTDFISRIITHTRTATVTA